MKKMIFVGEARIGEKGCIHQSDLATVLDAERITAWPKDTTDVQIVVGRLLKNRKPAMLVRAEKAGLTAVTVADVLNDDARLKLKELLSAKPKLETYEKAALEFLAGPAPELTAPKRGGKKSKVAHG